MEIFISWSGPLSRRVAEILREWLPNVLQAVQPYVSSKDIDKGARWSAEISQKLQDCNYGIICVTAANVVAPWLNFEAGALSKSFKEGRVSPFLFGIGKDDLGWPMKQFQSTVYDYDDMFGLVQSINNACDNPLQERRLEAAFQQWWPNLKTLMAGLDDIPSDEGVPGAPDQGTTDDVLTEILHIVRDLRSELTPVDSDTSHLAPLPSVRSQQDTAGPIISSPVAVPRRRHSHSADVPRNEPPDTSTIRAADHGQEWLGHLLEARERVRLARTERGSAQRQLLDALDGMAAALRAALEGDASRVRDLLIAAQEIRNDEGRRLLVAQQYESDAEASLDAALRSLMPSGE